MPTKCMAATPAARISPRTTTISACSPWVAPAQGAIGVEMFYFCQALCEELCRNNVGDRRVQILAERTRMSKFTPAQATSAIVVSYYWHFVDIVWIALWLVIYIVQ